MIRCENCNQQNKGRYRSFELEYEEGKRKIVTWCYDCLDASSRGMSDAQRFEHFQTPFWKIMGLKPKKREVALEKYLRWKGMSYGDWRRFRDHKENASHQSAYKQFEQHYNTYGRKNAPDPSFRKTS